MGILEDFSDYKDLAKNLLDIIEIYNIKTLVIKHEDIVKLIKNENITESLRRKLLDQIKEKLEHEGNYGKLKDFSKKI